MSRISARWGNRGAKPLAIVASIVGVGVLAWFGGRWSVLVAPMPSPRVPAVAPMQDQGARVAGDVLSSTVEAANAEEMAPQRTAAAPISTVPHADEVAQVSQDVMQPSTPVVPRDDATPRAKAPAPRRGDGLIYGVNVSSFRTPAAAAAEIAKLQKQGYQARAIRTDLGSKGIWYRVYVGQYATAAEARQARNEILERTGYSTAHVRPIVLL